jgi:transcriptional regulator with XRE-family HTH domain
LKRVARRLHANLADVRSQEQATSDLSLHTLYQWAEALNVPVTELLFEPDSALSMPVMRRAQAIRMMKTARAILEHGTVRVRRMAEMMINQLIEMMPELKEVEAWPAVGSRRRGAVGRAACQVIPASLLTSPPLD